FDFGKYLGQVSRASISKRLERFQAKWRPVRVKKTRQIKNLEPRFDPIETEQALGHHDPAAQQRARGAAELPEQSGLGAAGVRRIASEPVVMVPCDQQSLVGGRP